MKKVVIAAGGTGGHLLPAQQLGELLDKEHVIFAGYKLSLSPYFQREKFVFCEIPAAPLNSLKFWWQLCVGTWRALKLLVREKPDVVVGFGSYHTVPVLLAASILRKKIVLFEANRTLGKVNRLFRPFAHTMARQFLPKKPGAKDVLVARFPWKTGIAVSQLQARQELGLDARRFTVLVFGGSQGASFFNEMVPHIARLLPEVQWILVAGNEVAAQKLKEQHLRAHILGFSHNMPLLYAAADAAICRSGAGTVSELIRFQLPAILVPYPHATDDHQRHNADILVEQGAGICFSQTEVTAQLLADKLRDLDWPQMRLAFRNFEEHNDLRLEQWVRSI